MEGLGFREWWHVVLCVPDSKEVHNMRTNIEIDDKLMKDALKATGAKTKREAVELGLKTLVQLRAQEKARELKALFLDTCAPDVLRRGGLFRPDTVARLFREHQDGRHDHRKKLYTLLAFQLWAARHRVA